MESSYRHLNGKSKDSSNNINNSTATEFAIFNNIDYRRKRQLDENEKINANINKYSIQKRHLKFEKYFEYLNNRYRYEENEGLFVPATFFINRYTMSEIFKMKTGIPNMDLVINSIIFTIINSSFFIFYIWLNNAKLLFMFFIYIISIILERLIL